MKSLYEQYETVAQRLSRAEAIYNTTCSYLDDGLLLKDAIKKAAEVWNLSVSRAKTYYYQVKHKKEGV